jgi:site-specific DNA recombinase
MPTTSPRPTPARPCSRLDPLWDELFPAEQARIVALLIERVDIGTDGLGVRLRVDGLSGLARKMLAGDTEAAA